VVKLSKNIPYVYITDKQYVTKDDMYEDIFKCSHCDSENILNGFKYCPICGIKIRWRLKKYK